MDDAEGRFRVVFESTYPALVRYVRHRGLSGADADDLVAGTYEVAWRRWEKVPTDDGALPWLLAVARNLLRNRWRTQLRERAVLGLSCPFGGDSLVREIDVDAGAAEVDHRDQRVG